MVKGLVFGLNIGELLEIYNLDSQSWKMSGCLFTGDYAKSSGVLPKSGMMQNGKIYEQKTWVLRTKGKGSGLWRTPDTCKGGVKSKEFYEKCKKTGVSAIRLQDQVKHEMKWPTLDWSDRRSMKSKQQGLSNKVKRLEMEKFPTPQARDWKGKSQRGGHGNKTDCLPNAIEGTGQLNPQWVDVLMGYCPNWTKIV